eukprot:SM000083S22722  [mRNA]  locus=s83:109283:112005:+ [translate_table: standard]
MLGGGGGEAADSVRLFYRLYGHGAEKVLFIMGLAGTHDAWIAQIRALCGADEPHGDDADLRGDGGGGAKTAAGGEEGREVASAAGCAVDEAALTSAGAAVEEHDEEGGAPTSPPEPGRQSRRQCCAFDNRGVGRSSMPKDKSLYTTEIMARDAIALMDHLRWDRAHVVGHSMGGMIASKIATLAPDRVSSLALLSVTGGGYECIPKLDMQVLRLAYRFSRAKTVEDRASVDLDCHYTSAWLDTKVDGVTRREALFKEYVKNLSASGIQPQHGLDGHTNACWTHRLTPEDFHTIRSSGMPVAVVHGRGDVVARMSRAERIARKLHPVGRMVELSGAHMVLFENKDEVNELLDELIETRVQRIAAEEWAQGSGDRLQLPEGSSLSSIPFTSLLVDPSSWLASLPPPLQTVFEYLDDLWRRRDWSAGET